MLKNNFKSGDAIIYRDNNRWIIEAFVDGTIEDFNRWNLTYWFHARTPRTAAKHKHKWRNAIDEDGGSLPDSLCAPHPDPDDLLARLTAWRLLNG